MSDTVTTTGLSKRYGRVMCVNEVALSVPQGKVYGFLGPNGAGKTTTLKMILGLARPTAGNINVMGKTMNQRNRLEILKNVGSLIESPAYYGHLSGEENLRIIQLLRNMPESEIDRVLHIVRLEKQRKKAAEKYSLGMKQRLGLACAMLGNPALLILDEPTNGLDPAGIQEMRELICSLPQQYGMTVLVSSHLLGEIEQIASQVGIINAGQLVFQDSLEVLHKRSQRKIAIRTLDNALAGKILEEQGLTCTVHDGYLLLPNMEDVSIARCVAHLGSQQIGVVRIEQRQKSLEDIFLELTGKAVSL